MYLISFNKVLVFIRKRLRVDKMLPVLLCIFGVISSSYGAGMLKVRESESRGIQELNGMWDFRADRSTNRNESFEKQWWMQRLYKVSHMIHSHQLSHDFLFMKNQHPLSH